MKKILFVVCGIGYGHSTRCHAIIDQLKNTEVTIAGYNNSYEYFKNKHPAIKIRRIKLPDKNFRLDITRAFAANWTAGYDWTKNYLILKHTIDKFQPDLIITDNEPIGVYAGKKLGIKVAIIHNHDINDINLFQKERLPITFRLATKFLKKLLLWGTKNSDLIISPHLLGKDHQYINPIIRYIPKKSNKKQAILVMLGGSKFGYKFAKKLIDIIKDIDEEFIIFGYDKKSEYKNIKIYHYNDEFIDYLKSAKALITLAGHSTLSEAIVLKKPALVVPIPNHVEQILNARKIQNIYPVCYNHKKELKQMVYQFLQDLPKIQKRVEKLNVKGTGAIEAARLIEKL